KASPPTVLNTEMNSDTPSVWKLPLKEERTTIHGCRRYSFGEESNRENRTMILFGSGTSTLINGMVNYILGVKWEDSYRFKLVEAESQTSEVKVYKINHREGFQIPHSLTIIDTPGFGDTRGIRRSRTITQQLHRLFTDQSGVSEIDVICFVAHSALARLTPTQKHVFDSVLSIFGKDVAENIRILVMFADGQRPPVLEAINASGFPCPKTDDGLPAHFKFNNSALFAQKRSSDDEDGGFDEMVWNMGFQSMKRFFAALNQIKTKSLTMTNKVLIERQQLLVSVEKLQKTGKMGLSKLEEIKETAEKLQDLETEICTNENVEFEVTVKKPFQKDSGRGSGRYFTNCQQCHHTCHEDSLDEHDEDKIQCPAMGPDGHCTVCPGKCPWNVHLHQEFKWECREVKEVRKVKELKEKYQVLTEAEKPVQALISNLMKEYDVVNTEVEKLTNEATDCFNHLKEIALMPDPVSTPEYINMLIDAEKSEAKPGWEERVQSLIHDKEKFKTTNVSVSQNQLLAQALYRIGKELENNEELQRAILSVHTETRRSLYVKTALRLAGVYGALLSAVYYSS
uniref:AIG1-type G domain-containing protein n=1 Tax=Sphaeramia orbicularis TaxID=375764 RepID=A0A672Z2P2_9TELE